jgi:hypothetical protein
MSVSAKIEGTVKVIPKDDTLPYFYIIYGILFSSLSHGNKYA